MPDTQRLVIVNRLKGKLRLKSMSLPNPTVFLVDDDNSVLRALGRLIKSAGYEVQTFVSARSFLDSDYYQKGPACLVLDVRMPGLNGLDLQGELQAANATLPIIFITGHGDIPTTVRAMKAGAVDFLPKPLKDTVLLGAIEQALARAERDWTERRKLEALSQRLNTLTPREREVMALVVRGLLNKQIAFELGTVEKTIKVHRARVMQKMGVNSLAELVRVAEKITVPPKSKQVPARPARNPKFEEKWQRTGNLKSAT
jgi:FixJ family two-component response regulator